MKKYAVFIGMGFELLGIVLVGLYLGVKLEEKYPMKNLWPVLLIFAALAGWFYRVIVLLKRLNKDSNAQKPN